MGVPLSHTKKAWQANINDGETIGLTLGADKTINMTRNELNCD